MGRLLRRWAEDVTRKQLVRAIARREKALRELAAAKSQLRIERHANRTLRTLTDTWQLVARDAHEELTALRQQQGDTK